MRVCAVVVTHNRRALLGEALAALAAQTRPVDHVLVVDNASTDGTPGMLRREHPEVELLALSVNGGGAGGFHEGIRAAHAAGFDWLWLMDDDTIPQADALEQLLDALDRLEETPALLAGTVIWTDGTLHPMNQQGFERTRTDRLVDGAAQGLLPVRTSTFVSLLLGRETVDRYGLPLKGYFLWSDDIEYTARVLRRETGFLVVDSIAVHQTATPYTAVTTSGERFYFHVRNTLYMLRGPAWARWEKGPLALTLLTTTLAYLRHHRFGRRSRRIVARGLRDGLARDIPRPPATLMADVPPAR